MKLVGLILLCIQGLALGISTSSKNERMIKENIISQILKPLYPESQIVASCSFPDSELKVLEDIYISANGQEWLFDYDLPSYTIWNFTGHHNPCTENWQRLTCSYSGVDSCFVSILGMGHFGMRGFLPESLGNLTELTFLDVNYNRLAGTLPESITYLSNLIVMTLYANNIYGNLPSSWSYLSKLQVFDVGGNLFNGAVPSDLSQSLVIFDIKYTFLFADINLFVIGRSNLQFLAAESCLLGGPFPSNVQNLTNLLVLNLDNNLYEGTLTPDIFGHFLNLSQLIIGRNLLHGAETVLESLCDYDLLTLNVDENLFSGTLPSCIGNITSLKSLLIGGNLFEDEMIPEWISNLVRLEELDMNNMNLFGEIPTSLGNLSELTELILSNNEFTGSLPESLCNLLDLIEVIIYDNNLYGAVHPLMQATSLRIFEGSNNVFDGSIPITLCSGSIILFDVTNNFMTGTIPTCVGNLKNISHFGVGQNGLTGSIPSFRNDTRLYYFTLYNNFFTGILPDISGMRFLEYMFFQNNSFSGSFDNCIRSNYNGTKLVYIDVSTNILTGTLPSQLFQRSPLLESFSAASNCMSGSIPDTICAKRLRLLDLDGIGAASKCQVRFFPRVQLLDGYKLKGKMSGGIPRCLFNLTRLASLHLSGNAIEWKFPVHFQLPTALRELSLSHNSITGTIPGIIQKTSWEYLDLSYNKLNGELNPSFPVNANDTFLHLEVNRISGNIPAAFKSVVDISVLNGNLFDCSVDRKSLPIYDPVYGSYQCGSNGFNVAIGVWGGLLVGVVLLVIVGHYLADTKSESGTIVLFRQWSMRLQKVTSVLSYFTSTDSDSIELRAFHIFLNKLRLLLGFFTAVLIAIHVPVHIVLSKYFYTAKNQYAWTVGATFISGILPAVVLLFMWMGVIVVLYRIFSLKIFSNPSRTRSLSTRSSSRSSAVRLSIVSKQDILHYFRLAIIVLINCLLMIAINSLYVYIVIKYNSIIIFMTQILVALFKVFWNDIALRALVSVVRSFHISDALRTLDNGNIKESSGNVSLLSFLIVFNSIIAPLLANSAVEPQCFQNVFHSSDAVTGTIPYVECNIEESVAGPCTLNSVNIFTTSYVPPFIYSYQCTSSFVTNYASVYVYMFLFIAFFQPILLLALEFTYSRMLNYPNSCLLKIANLFVFKLMKPVNPKLLLSQGILFRKDRMILRIVSKLAVYLTFGVVFPPLAVVILLALIVDSYFNQILMGRYLSKVDQRELSDWLRLLGKDVRGCDKMLSRAMINFILPFTGIFYGFFLIDIYGDNHVGYVRALWSAILIALTPLFAPIFWLCRDCWSHQNDSKRPVSTNLHGVDMSILHTQVLKSDGIEDQQGERENSEVIS